MDKRVNIIKNSLINWLANFLIRRIYTMKTFIAGVGRALLFKGESLFADARTLADSTITINVENEEIH